MWFRRPKSKVVVKNQPYFDDLEYEDQNEFLKEAREVFFNPTFRKIINHLANLHFDKAAIESKNWEEVLTERALGAGVISVEQEFEKWNFEWEERNKKE